jgi:rubredoxin-NAD+ reductase
LAPVIIIGSGLAGYNVARELRKLDKQAPLTVIAADSGHFYSKPLLSNALTSNKAPEAIALNTPQQMAEQLQATVRATTRITAINTAQHMLHIGDEALPYSKLVLALGAEQIRLPIAGNAADRVLTVNDLDDYKHFRKAIEGKHRIAIIGAGLIGCEFANDLAGAGYAVDVIDIADRPLGRLLPNAGAALLRRKLEALGITWHFGTGTAAIDNHGDGLRVALNDGSQLDVDIVLSAIGLKPRTQLAQAAGLETKRGIVVNRMLETSAADVYALGDCAEVAGMVLPFVMPIMHAARALSATLAGKPTPVSYPAMPVAVKTPACPTVVSPPPPGASGEWQDTVSDEGVKSLFVDSSGKLLGFALNGNTTVERAALTQKLPPVLA